MLVWRPGTRSDATSRQLVMSCHISTEQLRSIPAAELGTGSAIAAATVAANGLESPGTMQIGESRGRSSNT